MTTNTNVQQGGELPQDERAAFEALLKYAEHLLRERECDQGEDRTLAEMEAAGDIPGCILQARAALAQRAASVPAKAVQDATIALDGHQLRMALDLINPDGEEGRDQMDDYLYFGVRQHQDDDGKISTGMCCWNDDTDGVLPLDGEYPDPAKDNCPTCGNPWVDHEFAVPAPYCPPSKVAATVPQDIGRDAALTPADIQKLADLHFYQQEAATMDIRLHRFAMALLAATPTANVAQAAPDESLEDMQEAVSDFRKATYEFARGQHAEDHKLMMDCQLRIFVLHRAALSVKAEPAASADQVVELNVSMLRSRSAVGVAKYGVTMADSKLPLRAWLEHALEESLDHANYLQRAMQEIDAAAPTPPTTGEA